MSERGWGGGNPWDHVQPWDVELTGASIHDPHVRRVWELAVRIAGGLPYIWRELARPVSEVVYGLLEVRPGDRVLIIGEGIEPAGWAEDLRVAVGPSGAVDTVEIIHEGRRAVHSATRGRNGMAGCWRWEYTDGIGDEHYDAVAVLQATQHADDWAETGRELLRVLKPGRRLVLAEAIMAGDRFLGLVNSDVHLREWFDKLYEQVNHAQVPYWSGEQVRDAFGASIENPQLMDWRGIDMFWGRKPAIPAGSRPQHHDNEEQE